MPVLDRPRVCLAFLWHMHQPSYLEPAADRFGLPWVRLHGCKDYRDLLELHAEHGVPCTLNVVPALIEQLADLVSGQRTDRYLEISDKPVKALDAGERRFVCDNFTSVHPRMLERFPRLAELQRRCRERRPAGARSTLGDDELRDLIVLFNLVWIDPAFRAAPELAALEERGRDFNEEDRERILASQRDILAGIVPLYRRLAARGAVELSTSPYFHPILPLLLDGESAREACPGMRLPIQPPRYPEDVDAQVAEALVHHALSFGVEARGLWPPEGAVSDAVARRLLRFPLTWIASDEGVLTRSALEANARPDSRQPYVVRDGEARLTIVFRQRELSDLIGVTYRDWAADRAAAHFVERVLGHGRRSPAPLGRPPLLAVIGDGENCWEGYADDGIPFLRNLFDRLADHPEIEPITIGRYLDRYPATTEIRHLFAGSWIRNDFTVWIGGEESNAAWDLLAAARARLGRATPAGWSFAEARGNDSEQERRLREAWRHLYAAEGSDWFWWYDDDFHSREEPVFDALFRARLAAVYTALGLPIPASCRSALRKRPARTPPRESHLRHSPRR